MQPSAVLDLTFWQVQAAILGYQNHLIDLRCVAVEQGYYAAYYANAKRATPVQKIIERILKGKQNSEHNSNHKSAPNPNIAAFQALEQIFKEVGNNGG